MIAIEAPSRAESMLAWGTVSAIILALGALVVGFTLAFQVARMRDQLETLVDDATPSFSALERSEGVPRREVPEAIAEFAEADTDPNIPPVTEPSMPAVKPRPKPSPGPRTDTEETDMPRQIEAAKLEAERDPIGTEWREFKKSDGTVMRFQVRK